MTTECVSITYITTQHRLASVVFMYIIQEVIKLLVPGRVIGADFDRLRTRCRPVHGVAWPILLRVEQQEERQ